MSFKFWIVNPNSSISQRWERLLGREGWTVTSLSDIQTFLSSASKNDIGIVLVDWGCLNGGAAGQALHSLKTKISKASFILTSAASLGNDQIIKMLESGADDYFLHDMHENLLTAKLKAHVRRLLPLIAEALDVLKAPKGDLKLDQTRKEVTIRAVGGKWNPVTELTPTELDLLALFLKRPGTALERRFIIETLWHDDQEMIRPGTIDKHVESLRKKLGKLGSRICTIYGHGYAYREKA